MLWVQVLNRSLEWLDLETARRQIAGTEISVPAHARLVQEASMLRGLYAAATLGRSLDESEGAGLSEWLAAVTLHTRDAVIQEAGLTSGLWADFGWPQLCAQRREAPLPARLDLLLSTALVQLAGAGDAVHEVQRCRGPRRGRAAHFGARDEVAFAVQAGLESLVERDGWSQCPRLVLAPRQARYCSKACSNAAFALRKGEVEPRYFAVKQKRYRVRRQQPAARARDSFSFVD